MGIFFGTEEIYFLVELCDIKINNQRNYETYLMTFKGEKSLIGTLKTVAVD
jgi:hypothetical protein